MEPDGNTAPWALFMEASMERCNGGRICANVQVPGSVWMLHTSPLVWLRGNQGPHLATVPRHGSWYCALQLTSLERSANILSEGCVCLPPAIVLVRLDHPGAVPCSLRRPTSIHPSPPNLRSSSVFARDQQREGQRGPLPGVPSSVRPPPRARLESCWKHGAPGRTLSRSTSHRPHLETPHTRLEAYSR